MSLSSNDQEFVHRCIYDYFIWTNNSPLLDAFRKAHPEVCPQEHDTTLPPTEPPLLITALLHFRDTPPPPQDSKGVQRPSSSTSSPKAVEVLPAPRPTTEATAAATTTSTRTRKRKSSSSSSSSTLHIEANTKTAAPTTTATTTSPALVWNDYYEVFTATMISNEQLHLDSLDPRGMQSWCVHQRWVYHTYHANKTEPSSKTTTTTTTALSHEAAESVSHLSKERIEKLNAVGFEWDMAKTTDAQDRIVVDRQTPSPTQLTRWKQELERYQPYLQPIDQQSKEPKAQSEQKVGKSHDSASNDDESSLPEKAQQWLDVQMERYRDWDAGFVDFPKEQRDSLQALNLLPELKEQTDHQNRCKLLLHGSTSGSSGSTDKPSDNHPSNPKSDGDNNDSDGESEDDEDSGTGSSSSDSENESESDQQGKTTTTTKIDKLSRTLAFTKANEMWHTHFQELEAFHKEHGHTQVTRKINLQLGRWVTKQRAKYRKNQESYPPERKKKLDELGFCWEPNSVTPPIQPKKITKTPSRIMVINWNDRLAQMKAFHQKYGHVHVTNSLDAKLSSWVKKERIRYRQNRDAYPSDRKKSLDDLGFCWEPIIAIKNKEHEPYPGTMAAEKEALWWKRLEELKDFKERFGHVRIPSRWTENRELSNWYRHTKERYRGFLEGKNGFPKNRQNALEEIDFHRLSQADRAPTTPTARTTTNPAEDTGTPVAVEVATKSDEETTKDNDAVSITSSNATVSDTSQAPLTQDPGKPQVPLDPRPTKTTKVRVENDARGANTDGNVNKPPIDPTQTTNDDVTNASDLFHPKRAVLWTSSRKRIRLPMQHGEKRPRRSVP